MPCSLHRFRAAVARGLIALLMTAGAVSLSAAPAYAAKMLFGTKDYLNRLQDTDIKGANGEALYLGYIISHHSLIAPYSMTDRGYVLGVVGQPDRFYPLDAATIARLQGQRLLPTPLPPYSPSAFDYIFGHLAWIILAGIIASLGLGAVRNAAQRKRAQKAMPFANAGLAQHRAGNLDAAVAEYGKAIAIHAGPDVIALRAEAHKARGDIDGAIADYSKFITANAKHAGALVARGEMLAAKGLHGPAINDYTRAIKVCHAPLAYFLRGTAYLRTGKVDAAIKDFTRAIDRNGDEPAFYQGRAAAYAQAGRNDLTQADTTTAAALAAARASTAGRAA